MGFRNSGQQIYPVWPYIRSLPTIYRDGRNYLLLGRFAALRYAVHTARIDRKVDQYVDHHWPNRADYNSAEPTQPS